MKISPLFCCCCCFLEAWEIHDIPLRAIWTTKAIWIEERDAAKGPNSLFLSFYQTHKTKYQIQENGFKALFSSQTKKGYSTVLRVFVEGIEIVTHFSVWAESQTRKGTEFRPRALLFLVWVLFNFGQVSSHHIHNSICHYVGLQVNAKIGLNPFHMDCIKFVGFLTIKNLYKKCTENDPNTDSVIFQWFLMIFLEL